MNINFVIIFTSTSTSSLQSTSKCYALYVAGSLAMKRRLRNRYIAQNVRSYLDLHTVQHRAMWLHEEFADEGQIVFRFTHQHFKQ